MSRGQHYTVPGRCGQCGADLFRLGDSVEVGCHKACPQCGYQTMIVPLAAPPESLAKGVALLLAFILCVVVAMLLGES